MLLSPRNDAVYTLEELKERIVETTDPDVLVELLNISSDELVEGFSDKIEARYQYLMKELFDEDEETSEA